ncbi:hypothetical protein HDU67_005566, partial [Dinochytrium kinnereticum]
NDENEVNLDVVVELHDEEDAFVEGSVASSAGSPLFEEEGGEEIRSIPTAFIFPDAAAGPSFRFTFNGSFSDVSTDPTSASEVATSDGEFDTDEEEDSVEKPALPSLLHAAVDEIPPPFTFTFGSTDAALNPFLGKNCDPPMISSPSKATATEEVPASSFHFTFGATAGANSTNSKPLPGKNDSEPSKIGSSGSEPVAPTTQFSFRYGSGSNASVSTLGKEVEDRPLQTFPEPAWASPFSFNCGMESGSSCVAHFGSLEVSGPRETHILKSGVCAVQDEGRLGDCNVHGERRLEDFEISSGRQNAEKRYKVDEDSRKKPTFVLGQDFKTVKDQERVPAVREDASPPLTKSREGTLFDAAMSSPSESTST